MKMIKSVMLGSLLVLSSAAMAAPAHQDQPVKKVAHVAPHQAAKHAAPKPVLHKAAHHPVKKPVKKAKPVAHHPQAPR